MLPDDEPIRAGETARRVVFTGIKTKWVTLGYTSSVVLRDPNNNRRVVAGEAGDPKNQSVASMTTELNPFPIPGAYKLQLWLTKNDKVLKGKIIKIIIEASN